MNIMGDMERKITLVVFLMVTIISLGLTSIPAYAGIVGPTCTLPPLNMISWWPLDELAGTTAEDIEDGNDGTHLNSPTPIAGKVAGALSFDGFDQNVEIPDSSSLNPIDEITIDAWIFIKGNLPGTSDIVTKDAESNPDRQYLLLISGDKLRAHVNTGSLEVVNGSTSLSLNTWYHIAMTYDGNFLKVYLNGVQDASSAVTGSIITTAQPVRIGGGAVPAFNPQHFEGIIDEVEIFDRALSQPEIQAIYVANSAGKCKEAIAVGGTFVPIDNSALILAGAQSISMWMIPVVVAGIGIGVFVIKRRN